MRNRLLVMGVGAFFIMGAQANSCTFDSDGSGAVNVTPTCDGAPCPVAPSTEPADSTGTTGTTVTISPQTISLPRSGRATFSKTVTPAGVNTNDGVTWSATGGNVLGDGSYTAPNVPGIYRVRATSAGDASAWAEAVVTVKQISIEITPRAATVEVQGNLQFIATVSGTANQAVSWSIVEGQGSDNGTIEIDGTFNAPGTVPGAKIHVQATSAEDPTVSATAAVTISETPVSEIFVCPASATLETNEILRLHAFAGNKVLNEANVRWRLLPAPGQTTGGAVLSGNILVAGSREAGFIVRAESVTGHYADAEITVRMPAHKPVRGYVRADPASDLTKDVNVVVIDAQSGADVATRKGPGGISIRGLAAETFPRKLLAWADKDRRGTFVPQLDPFAVVEVASPDDFLDVTLEKQGPTGEIPAGHIDNDGVVTNSNSAVVMFSPLKRADWAPAAGLDVEIVDAYKLEVSSDPTFAAADTTQKTVPAGHFAAAVFSSLASDATYHARVRGVRGRSHEGAWSPVVTFSLAAPNTGKQVSGSLDLSKLLVTSANVLILAGQEGAGTVITGATATTQATFSINGLPTGHYGLSVLVDADGDGIFERGEATRENAAFVFVAGADLSGVSLGLEPSATWAQVTTDREDADEYVTARAGSGTSLLYRASTAYRAGEFASGMLLDPEGGFLMTRSARWALSPFGDLRVGGQLGVTTTTIDGVVCNSSMTIPTPPRSVMAINVSSMSSATEPTIQWSNPSWESTTQGLILSVTRVSSGNTWEVPLPKTDTAYTVPAEKALTSGAQYRVAVRSVDANGNSAAATVTYNVPAP